MCECVIVAWVPSHGPTLYQGDRKGWFGRWGGVGHCLGLDKEGGEVSVHKIRREQKGAPEAQTEGLRAAVALEDEGLAGVGPRGDETMTSLGDTKASEVS